MRSAGKARRAATKAPRSYSPVTTPTTTLKQQPGRSNPYANQALLFLPRSVACIAAAALALPYLRPASTPASSASKAKAPTVERLERLQQACHHPRVRRRRARGRRRGLPSAWLGPRRRPDRRKPGPGQRFDRTTPPGRRRSSCLSPRCCNRGSITSGRGPGRFAAWSGCPGMPTRTGSATP